MDRITSEAAFVEILRVLEKRSTCIRRNVAAIIVREGMILSTGYNGPPHGLAHCQVCLRKHLGIPSGERMEICRAVHAEQNALIQCSLKQTNPAGAVIYSSASPCVTCAKLIIQAGIVQVNFLEAYKDDLAFEMMNEAGIKLNHIGG